MNKQNKTKKRQRKVESVTLILASFECQGPRCGSGANGRVHAAAAALASGKLVYVTQLHGV